MKKSLVLTSLAVATLALSACASDMGYRGGGDHHARPGGGNHSNSGRPNNGAHRPDANPGRPNGRPNQQGRPNGGPGHNGSRPPMGNSGPAACRASDYTQYVGRMQNTVPSAPRGLTFRLIGPNTPTTRDMRADRVNFNYNARGIITSVTCG